MIPTAALLGAGRAIRRRRRRWRPRLVALGGLAVLAVALGWVVEPGNGVFLCFEALLLAGVIFLVVEVVEWFISVCRGAARKIGRMLRATPAN